MKLEVKRSKIEPAKAIVKSWVNWRTVPKISAKIASRVPKAGADAKRANEWPCMIRMRLAESEPDLLSEDVVLRLIC